jgi:bisphosphoglycerate-dependent phosphoglycerate mutase
MTQVRLILLRHGQSEWNAAGIFTGWENAHLTGAGEEEATRAGSLLAQHGVLPACAHTSLQRRTIRTADLAQVAPGTAPGMVVRIAAPAATACRLVGESGHEYARVRCRCLGQG